MTYNLELTGTASIIRRQDFESHVSTVPGLNRGHLDAILEAFGTEALVMVETHEGFGVIGTLVRVGVTPGYGTPTLGIRGLYEDATVTYYRGTTIQQVAILNGGPAAGKHAAIRLYADWKMDALRAVRATLTEEDANHGKWEMDLYSKIEVSVTRIDQNDKRAPKNRWTVRNGEVRKNA